MSDHIVKPGVYAETRSRNGRRARDLTNFRTGMVTVLYRIVKDPKLKCQQARWWCRCDCGNEFACYSSNLTSRRQGSCGCTRAETARRQQTTHGLSSHRVYHIWSSIRVRCADLSNKYWGGAGITMHEPWRVSFQAFLDDVGMPPTKFHSMDRYPDPNGNYEPGNVRWATRKQQANNRRNTVFLTRDDVTKSAGDWASQFLVPHGTFKWWLRDYGEVEAFRRAEQRYRDTLEFPDGFV